MNRLHANTVAILNKDGTDDGKFVTYEWVLSSLMRNHYQYAMSLEVLKSFRSGLKAKPVPVLTDHRLGVNNIIGRVENPHIRGDSELIAKVMLQKGLPDVHSDAIIDRVNAGTLTDGSIGFDWNEAYFKCDLCDSEMQIKYGFAFDDNGHFLGEKDDKGQMVTAVLYGNPTIYEFSLVPIGADPDAEIVNGLRKVMTENRLGIGALRVAAGLQNLNLDKLCEDLRIDPNSDPDDSEQMRLEAINEDLTLLHKQLEARNNALKHEISERPTIEECNNLARKVAELRDHVEDPNFVELIRLAKQGEECLELMQDIATKACKSKYLAEGVSESNISLHTGYKKSIADIKTLTCVRTLHLVAQSDYRMAGIDFDLTSLHIQREREAKAEEQATLPKRVWLSGANDIR